MVSLVFCGTPVPSLIRVPAALDVNGPVAMEIWGGQWLKLLALLYEGCLNGIFGQKDRLVGGKSPDGVASRVRVQVDIERLMTMA